MVHAISCYGTKPKIQGTRMFLFQSVKKMKFPLKIIFFAVKDRFLDFPLFFITSIDLSGILCTNLFEVSCRISTHTDFILFLDSTIFSVGGFSRSVKHFLLEFPTDSRLGSDQDLMLTMVAVLFRNLETTYLSWQLDE